MPPSLRLPRSLGYVLSGLAGILIGFLVGRGVSQSPTVPTATLRHQGDIERAGEVRGSEPTDAAKAILLGKINAVPFQELYGVLAKRSPAEIASLAEQLRGLPEGRDKLERIGAFFKAWAHLDPAAALQASLAFQSADAREAALNATIAGADPTSAAALAQSINKLSADVFSAAQKFALLTAAIGKWSKVDAPAAAAFLSSSPEAGVGFTPAFYEVAQNWATDNPEAAMNWALEHSSGMRGASALSGAINGWWEKDHAAAEAYAAAHAGGQEGQQLVSAIASQMGRSDPLQAAAWVQTLPTPEARRDGFNMVAIQWAMNDPKAASSWAAGLPNEQRTFALASTVSFWAQNDPQASGQWLQTLDGAARDQAASAYSYAIAQREPAAAMSWAASVSDGAMRGRALQQTASQWKERDPAAAQAWIESSSLDPAEKARLLAPPTPSPAP